MRNPSATPIDLRIRNQSFIGPRRHQPSSPCAVTVRSVDTPEYRDRAARLLERRYRWRGYGHTSLPPERHPQRCTLAAEDPQRLLGTLTVAFDGPDGLNCDALFGAEVSALRAAGAKVCEFSRLAVDTTGRQSGGVLTALFHAAYTMAHLDCGCDTLLVEVHPRHVRYYERMFGAELLAAQRHHPGVNAPAVLLSLSLAELAALARQAEQDGFVDRARCRNRLPRALS
ncbi:MAG: N-acetyltransferase [Betaproteobacteria bacterium]|nr:N-acetyltransferase [Betaproteobacteria bacterium]MBK8862467.1 N-acetyltransferase [Betaproteobacteria bacterium]